MDVKQVILADYANVSREGKLNVLGIFTQINATGFPTLFPQMQVIISWQAQRTESGRAKKIEIELRDEDGKRLGGFSQEFVVPDGKPGRIIAGNHIVGITGLRLDKPGSYAFHVLINGEDKGSAGFEALLAKAPPK